MKERNRIVPKYSDIIEYLNTHVYPGYITYRLYSNTYFIISYDHLSVPMDKQQLVKQMLKLDYKIRTEQKELEQLKEEL